MSEINIKNKEVIKLKSVNNEYSKEAIQNINEELNKIFIEKNIENINLDFINIIFHTYQDKINQDYYEKFKILNNILNINEDSSLDIIFNEIRSIKIESSKINMDIEEHKKKTSDYISLSDKLEKDFKVKENICNELNTKLINLENSLKIMTEENNKLKNTLINIENENLLIKNEINDSVKNLTEEYNREIEKFKNIIQDHENENKKSKNELKEFKENSLINFEKEKDEIKNFYESKISEDNNKLNEIIRNHEEEKKNLNENLSKYIEINKNLLEKSNELNSFNSDLNLKISELEKSEVELKNLKMEFEKHKLDHLESFENKSNEYKNIEQEYKSNIKNLEDINSEKINELKTLNETINVMNARYAEFRELYNKVVTNLKEKEEKIEFLKNENQLYINNIDQLRKNIDLNESHISELEKELIELKSPNQDNLNLKAINEALVSENLDKTKLISKYKEETKIYLRDIENKQKMIAELEIKLTEKQESLQRIEHEFEIKMSSIDEEKKIQFQKMKEEKIILIENYEKKLFEANIIVEKLEDKIRNLEMNSSTDKVDILKNKCNQIFTKLKTELTDIEYMIDQRIISNLIMNYFEKGSNEKLKLALLDTLANMLGYNNEERKKLGLSPNTYQITVNNSNYFERLLELLNDLFNFIQNL